jgi:hypothetical protein
MKKKGVILFLLIATILFTIFFLTNFVSATEGGYLTYWTLDAVNGQPFGMFRNETFFWISDNADAEVYKYWTNGTYTGNHWDTAANGGCVHPRGMTSNFTFVWFVNYGSNAIYKYYFNGTYAGSISTAGVTADPRGLTTNNTFIWVSDAYFDEVYKFFMNGTYTGNHWDTAASGNSDPVGLANNNVFIWSTDPTNEEVWKYYINGTYTGTHFDTTTAGNGAPLGIAQNGTFIWVSDVNNGRIYIYEGPGIFNTTIDLTPPYFTTIPANASLFYGNQSLSVDFDAADARGFGYFAINDTKFSITQAGILTNVTPMTVGNYEINVTINDTSNNINWIIYKVQVNKSLAVCQVLFNETSPLTYPKTFLVWTNCASAFVLARNGTTISNNSEQALLVGAYNFSVKRNDIVNYSNYYNERQFIINDVCVPTTCSDLNKNCGTVSDGCGGTLNCGTCSTGYTCNATGQCVVTTIYYQDFEGNFPPTGWKTGGDANWNKNISYTVNGSACAASGGPLGNNNKSWINYTNTFSNDGYVSFYWNVSSEQNWDYLCFCQDKECGASGCTCANSSYGGGSADAKITGSGSAWRFGFVNKSVNAGNHFFTWCYVTDAGALSGKNMGIIDNVTFFPNSYTPCTPNCAGRVCGSDGCGGSCGTCSTGYTCLDGICTCFTESDSTFCSRLGKNCGSVTANDNCGITRTVSSCGTCTFGTCQNNVCTCIPTTCSNLNRDCGIVSDGCGGTLNCGTCSTGYTCQVNGTCINNSVSGSQIIADHTIVDRFDDIPQCYIDKVKTMWFDSPGESHASGILYGIGYVEQDFPIYQSNYVLSGTPEAYTNAYLRVSQATWGDLTNPTGWMYNYGEEDWFTNPTAINRTKAGLSYSNSIGLAPSAFGFAWCADMDFGDTESSAVDPVYGCHWYGVSDGGPQGDRCWGLDAEDNAITGNTINMDTYLSTTQEYIDYCAANNIPTKVFFSTGPVNSVYSLEKSYQAYLKMEHIRDYVKADPTRILFDYADILTHDDNGSVTTLTWNNHTFPTITPTNLGSGSIGHIGRAGALRLGKATWWMMARMAGWDGISTTCNIPPNIIINSPMNQTYTKKPIILNITATANPGIGSCWYSLDGKANITMTNTIGNYWIATTSLIAKGFHNVTFYCNDSSGILSSKEEFFSFDKAYSQVSLSYTVIPNCSVVSGEGIPVLLVNGEVVAPGTAYDISQGNYSFNCSIAESEDYYYSEKISNLIIWSV